MPVNYYEYIRSAKWKKKADEAKRRAGYTCQRCHNYSHRLEAHHKTYKYLGNEPQSDIEVLCPNCHDFVTSEQKKATSIPSRRYTGSEEYSPEYPDGFLDGFYNWVKSLKETIFRKDWYK